MLWNFTVDAPSPYISYSGSWGQVENSDPGYVLYSNRTAIYTGNVGDSAKFSFDNGTGIWVYGAKRPNHGDYIVQFDNGPGPTFNGSGDNVFQAVLFSQDNLKPSQHELTMTFDGYNGSGSGWFFDIDYIVYQASLPDLSRSVVIDNTDASFEYLPSSSDWDSSNDSSSFNTTLARTKLSNGQAQITFTGCAAAGVYGRMASENGKYLCQMDNQTSTQFSANWTDTANQQLLCFASGLDSGSGVKHTMTISNHDTNAWLEIDFVQLYGPNPMGMPFDVARPSETSVDTHKSKFPVGALVGGIVGGIGLIVGALLVLRLRLRRRKRQLGPTAIHRRSSNLDDAERPSAQLSFPADPLGIYTHPQATEADLTISFSSNPTHTPLLQLISPEPPHARSSTSLLASHQSTQLPAISPTPVSSAELEEYGLATNIYERRTLSTQTRPRHQPWSRSESSSTTPTTGFGTSSSLRRRAQDAGPLSADDTATLPPDYDSDWGTSSAHPSNQPQVQAGYEQGLGSSVPDMASNEFGPQDKRDPVARGRLSLRTEDLS